MTATLRKNLEEIDGLARLGKDVSVSGSDVENVRGQL